MSHGVRATDPPLTAPTQCIVLQNVCVWGGGVVCARGLVAAPVFGALPTYHGESIVCGRKGFVSQTRGLVGWLRPPCSGPYLPTTANRSCAAERVLSVKPKEKEKL
jgi:hypothetical protein